MIRFAAISKKLNQEEEKKTAKISGMKLSIKNISIYRKEKKRRENNRYASMLCKNAEFPSRDSISNPIVVAVTMITQYIIIIIISDFFCVCISNDI